jgi:CheY-like chemotaxis protein
MNDIVTGAMTEIQSAIKQIDEMSSENSLNFADLKQETEKFKVSDGEEKEKILIVDDDEIHLEVTKNILGREYEINTAKSGKEAISLFHRGLVPNLILLDLIMPDMDGWETYQRIKAIGNLHHISIAFFTSSTNPEDIKKAQQMGIVDYIQKPIKGELLLDRVKKIIK